MPTNRLLRRDLGVLTLRKILISPLHAPRAFAVYVTFPAIPRCETFLDPPTHCQISVQISDQLIALFHARFITVTY